MKIILYVETNFLMSIATGREPKAEGLLTSLPTNIMLVLPSICCMEALSAFEDEKKRRNQFSDILDKQISQLERDLTSESAKALFSHLQEAKINNSDLLNDVQARLYKALEDLTNNVATKRVALIDLAPEILQESLNNILINDPTDNLILTCILSHSRLISGSTKAFLSGNVRDFKTENVLAALSTAGIYKYLSRIEDFLGWLNSQP